MAHSMAALITPNVNSRQNKSETFLFFILYFARFFVPLQRKIARLLSLDNSNKFDCPRLTAALQRDNKR